MAGILYYNLWLLFFVCFSNYWPKFIVVRTPLIQQQTLLDKSIPHVQAAAVPALAELYIGNVILRKCSWKYLHPIPSATQAFISGRSSIISFSLSHFMVLSYKSLTEKMHLFLLEESTILLFFTTADTDHTQNICTSCWLKQHLCERSQTQNLGGM